MRTHYCRHKCFPVCQRAQHLLRTQILCPGHKNVSDFVQKHFVSTTNVSQFAQPKTHHGQQCVRNNVSSFTRALSLKHVHVHRLCIFRRKCIRTLTQRLIVTVFTMFCNGPQFIASCANQLLMCILVGFMETNLRWLNRVMQDHEARASDLNRKLVFSFFLLFS